MWKFAYFLMIFISERFNFSLIEAGLAEAYCENWQLTVEETLNAQACELELLQKFCQAWQIVSAVGREAFSDWPSERLLHESRVIHHWLHPHLSAEFPRCPEQAAP